MNAGQPPRSPARLHGSPAPEPHGLLPPWPAVLAVVAHPDDESFGLGAIIDTMTSAGAAVHLLCYTRGEASTLNQAGADLYQQRARELRQAGAAGRHAPLPARAEAPHSELEALLSPAVNAAVARALRMLDVQGYRP